MNAIKVMTFEEYKKSMRGFLKEEELENSYSFYLENCKKMNKLINGKNWRD